MQEKMITLYCVCADFLSTYGYEEEAQVEMTPAEVMTVVLVASAFFVGNPGIEPSVPSRTGLHSANAFEKPIQPPPSCAPRSTLASVMGGLR